MEFKEYGKNISLKDWRFSGRCIDEKTGKLYMFCTNSIYEYNQFISKGEKLGMRLVDGSYNDNYKVVRRLLEK